MEVDMGFQRLDFSVHVSRVEGKIGSLYKEGFDRTEFPLDSIAELIARFCWSPIIWMHGIRKSENFMLSQLVALDFDSPEYSIKQAINDWCDTVHIIGTTHNHLLEKNGVTCERFRIVSVWDSPITNPFCYKPSMTKLLRENRAEHADKKCADLARFFFPCRSIVSVQSNGYLVQSVKDPPQKKVRKLQKLAGMPASALKYLMQKSPGGERNWSSYKFAFDCARAGYQQDDVVQWVRSSKTYENEGDKNVLDQEIPATVNSAYKKWRESEHG